MKKWTLLIKDIPQDKKEIVQNLLQNRQIKDEKSFFTSSLDIITAKKLQIDEKQIKKFNKRIETAIKEKELIIIYSDYDADGICGAAILYEWIASMGGKVMPYVPDRESEGYGISKMGIDNFKLKMKIKDEKILIITIDNGITANEAIEYANSLGINVMVIDHHALPEKAPEAYAIIHTTKLCAGGLAWFVAGKPETSLDLAGIATIADMVPLNNENRIIAKLGIEQLSKTKRPGLLAMFNEAGLKLGAISAYEVGFIIAPRINAMGRMENALDSLRLLCTHKEEKAKELAQKLGMINRERQELTVQTFFMAKNLQEKKQSSDKLIFLYHEEFNQGIIGLVAGKMAELYYRPAVIVSRGLEISKASARSISGFNIIEAIRSCEELLINAGGHPMAAGFTIATDKLDLLEKKLTAVANEQITEEQRQKELKIDLELPLDLINIPLYEEIQRFAPFGIGNPEPLFVSRDMQVVSIFTVGINAKHLKLQLTQNNKTLEGIAFGMGERAAEIKAGTIIDAVYTISLDTWNGNQKLTLKIKDLIPQK